MWRRIELEPKEGLFVLKNGIYQEPRNVLSEDKDKIAGYVLDTSGNFSGKNIIIPINSSENCMEWGIYNGVMYSVIEGLNKIKDDQGYIKFNKDKNGKLNSTLIVNHLRKLGKSIGTESPALGYCINFSPGFKDGEWYLPSMGELKLFYDKRRRFRESCRIIGLGTNMYSDNSGYCNFWSSTEYSKSYVWSLNFHGSYPLPFYYDKFLLRNIVPFLAF